jgi:transposase-like protein
MAAARFFTVEFRIAVAQRILNGESVSALSNELNIKRSVLYRWRDGYREQGADGLNRPRGRPPKGITRPVRLRSAPAEEVSKASPELAAAERRVAALEQRLGKMVLENDFLARAFRRVKEARSKNTASGESRCTEK